MEKESYKKQVKKKLKRTIADIEELDEKVTVTLNNTKAKAAMLCEPAVVKSKDDLESQLEELKQDQRNLKEGKITPESADKDRVEKKQKAENALDRIKSQFPENE